MFLAKKQATSGSGAPMIWHLSSISSPSILVIPEEHGKIGQASRFWDFLFRCCACGLWLRCTGMLEDPSWSIAKGPSIWWTASSTGLPAAATAFQGKRLIVYYICRNAFHSQLIASSFSKHAGNYLTRAGIDYELHQFILSKTQFPSAELSDKDALANSLYSSPEK